MKHSHFIAATLAVCFTFINCARAADTAPLKVSAAITGKVVVRGQASYRLVLRVENVSGKPQIIHSMSCSWWDDWETDNPHILLQGWNCAKNIRQIIELAPGGSFTDTLTVTPENPLKGKSTFRAGFKAGGGDGAWSNEIDLRLESGAPAFKLEGTGTRTFGAGCKVGS